MIYFAIDMIGCRRSMRIPEFAAWFNQVQPMTRSFFWGCSTINQSGQMFISAKLRSPDMNRNEVLFPEETGSTLRKWSKWCEAPGVYQVLNWSGGSAHTSDFPSFLGWWKPSYCCTHWYSYIMLYHWWLNRNIMNSSKEDMDRWKSRGGKSRREKIRERVRRKKMPVREKVAKSRNTVFFQWFVAPEGQKVGSLKRRVRSHVASWEMKNCTPL